MNAAARQPAAYKHRSWLYLGGFGLVCTGPFALYALYAAIFFAWAAATPTQDLTHDQAQRYADTWGAVFAACIAIMVVGSVFLIRAALRGQRDGGRPSLIPPRQ